MLDFELKNLHFLGQQRINLLEKGHCCVGCAVDHWLEVSHCYVDAASLAEFAEVNPVILFLLKLETVIKLIHLDVVGKVALQDLSDEPSVAQVALRVGDLVGQVEGLDPLVEFARQGVALGVDCESHVVRVTEHLSGGLNLL